MERPSHLLPAIILGISLIIDGLAIAWAIKLAGQSDRIVTVKGLAERHVQADQGTWRLQFSSSGDVMDDAIKQNANARNIVLQFLTQNGFEANEIRPGTPNVVEQNNYNNNTTRYNVSDSVLIVSNKVSQINKLAQEASQLLSQGVALTGWEKPSYNFSDLGSIKPQMIEEATKDAREAAEKFAKDSQSKVGAIFRASQGYFSFNGESIGIPENEQIKKIARVVISVDYFLVD